MASIKQLLKDIEKSPRGPQIAAIFDFDGTLIAGYSATTFIREQIRRKELSPRQLVELVTAMTNFGLGNLGFSGMMAVNAQFMRGVNEATYEEVGEQLYTKHISRLIYPESRALVDAHLARGHTVAIISSATPYQVKPAAADLGIEHVLCTYLEVEDGKLTGGVVRPTCFGQGKVDAAEALAKEHGSDLDKSFFYSDSKDDLLLLERVGLPRALNPSGSLERIAHARQWPVAHFGSRGRPSVGQFLRSVAATGSLVTSFVAGLPVYALTGSRRESQNFSFSLFADTSAALIGLDLNVKGEKNLWAQRPAVFIFNHQSKADVIIVAKLLRRDIAGIGKQEIKKDTPILGAVLEYGGTVFIDRANARNAIEAMAPLVDAMKNEGKSVVLAPEGTRTVSPRLLPFKKGAFHLAMQAGVPIVPIVIRNAGDVAPKGDFVFRSATVDVQVLPPVDTSKWSKATLDEHVREVRNMFARAMGQPEEKAGGARSAAKKAPAKRRATASKKIAVKKAPAKKSASKKAPVKKAAAKKATVKKAAVKKTASKKPAAGKTAAGKAGTKKTQAKRKSAPAGKTASRKTSVRPKTAARPKTAGKSAARPKTAASGKARTGRSRPRS